MACTCQNRFPPTMERKKWSTMKLDWQKEQDLTDKNYLTGPLSEIRSKCWEIMYSPDSTDLEKYDAAIQIFRTYYTRSLNANGFDPSHPKFEDYCAMLLNQQRFKNDLDTNVYTVLVKEYGEKSGLPNDETTWQIEKLLKMNKYGEGLWRKRKSSKSV